uniref:RNA-binding protein 48 n=2 Tax=Cyprinus carpio TaxID=7962 RepID=A0A8C1A1V9_CYPCA
MQLQITTITYRLKTETFILKPGELFTLVADFTTQMDSSVANPSVWDTQKVFKHHEQRNVAQTRPKYREGRRLKAVKVYTINLESRFLLVQGVPAIGVMAELVQLFALYGVIEEYRALDEYPAEQFTEVYLFQFQKLTSARVAKWNTDEKSFFGGQLHVCYAPEYETVEETRQKLQDRRRYVNRASQNTAKQQDRQLEESTESSSTDTRTAAAPEIQKGFEKARMENVNSDDMGFSVLPLTPVEDVSYRLHGFEQPLQLQWTTDTTLPTEDKMGSLHNAIPPVTETSKQCASSASYKKERDLIERQKNLSPSVRFMPRTTHLESRKRKLEGQAFFLNEAAETETLIGPKLPELPKVDMEDHSLNVTTNLIRQTMSKVTSVPEIKPVQVKTPTAKPRRRI